MLLEIARKPMGNVSTLKKPTLKSLAAEMRRLQERVEDMEDLIELRSAIERNAGKPGVSPRRCRDASWVTATAQVAVCSRSRGRASGYPSGLECPGHLPGPAGHGRGGHGGPRIEYLRPALLAPHRK